MVHFMWTMWWVDQTFGPVSQFPHFAHFLQATTIMKSKFGERQWWKNGGKGEASIRDPKKWKLLLSKCGKRNQYMADCCSQAPDRRSPRRPRAGAGGQAAQAGSHSRPAGRVLFTSKECRPHLRARSGRGGAARPRLQDWGKGGDRKRGGEGRLANKLPTPSPAPTSGASRARPRACPAGDRLRRGAACWAPPPRDSTGPALPRRSGKSAGWTSPAAWPGPPLRSFSAAPRWMSPWSAPPPPFGPNRQRTAYDGREDRGTGLADWRTDGLTDVRSACVPGPATSGSSSASALDAGSLSRSRSREGVAAATPSWTQFRLWYAVKYYFLRIWNSSLPPSCRSGVLTTFT